MKKILLISLIFLTLTTAAFAQFAGNGPFGRSPFKDGPFGRRPFGHHGSTPPPPAGGQLTFLSSNLTFLGSNLTFNP